MALALRAHLATGPGAPDPLRLRTPARCTEGHPWRLGIRAEQPWLRRPTKTPRPTARRRTRRTRRARARPATSRPGLEHRHASARTQFGSPGQGLGRSRRVRDRRRAVASGVGPDVRGGRARSGRRRRRLHARVVVQRADLAAAHRRRAARGGRGDRAAARRLRRSAEPWRRSPRRAEPCSNRSRERLSGGEPCRRSCNGSITPTGSDPTRAPGAAGLHAGPAGRARSRNATLRRTGRVPPRRTKRSSATSSSRTTTTPTGQTQPREAYNDHGELTEHPGTQEPAPPETDQPWNPRRQGERRAHPRHREDPAGHEDPEDPEDPGDQDPGPHIDILA